MSMIIMSRDDGVPSGVGSGVDEVTVLMKMTVPSSNVDLMARRSVKWCQAGLSSPHVGLHLCCTWTDPSPSDLRTSAQTKKAVKHIEHMSDILLEYIPKTFQACQSPLSRTCPCRITSHEMTAKSACANEYHGYNSPKTTLINMHCP